MSLVVIRVVGKAQKRSDLRHPQISGLSKDTRFAQTLAQARLKNEYILWDIMQLLVALKELVCKN